MARSTNTRAGSRRSGMSRHRPLGPVIGRDEEEPDRGDRGDPVPWTRAQAVRTHNTRAATIWPYHTWIRRWRWTRRNRGAPCAGARVAAGCAGQPRPFMELRPNERAQGRGQEVDGGDRTRNEPDEVARGPEGMVLADRGPGSIGCLHEPRGHRDDRISDEASKGRVSRCLAAVFVQSDAQHSGPEGRYRGIHPVHDQGSGPFRNAPRKPIPLRHQEV
jgi:hypothetical protein